MQLINSSARLDLGIYNDDISQVMAHLEKAGRIAYLSENLTGDEGRTEDFIRNIFKRGHESVIEHVSVSATVICDRGVSHEIVRHRLGSYTQESTRYCNYSNQDKFNKGISFIRPDWVNRDLVGEYKTVEDIIHKYGRPPTMGEQEFLLSCLACEIKYNSLIEKGLKPQQARAVLINATKTKMMITYNLREWRHFFKLRCAKDAHPDMRVVANTLLREFKAKLPVIFEDIECE